MAPAAAFAAGRGVWRRDRWSATAGAGRKAIYLGWHAIDILGIPAPESRVLMADLLELSSQRKFAYRHAWQPGDLE